MTFEQYIPLANRTLNDLGSRRYNLAHMGLGIAGEFLEIQQSKTRENMAEELGDMLWFVAGAITLLDEEYDVSILQLDVCEFHAVCCDAVDMIKKHYAYKTPICSYMTWQGRLWIKWYTWRGKRFIAAHDLKMRLYMIVDSIKHECKGLGLDFSQIMEDNISKLRKRYPSGYSDYHAAVRLDKNETKGN